MAVWVDVLDTVIDAYSPITAKLIARLRNRDQLNRQQVLPGTNSTWNTVSAPTSYTTIGTFRVYVPDCYVGPSNTILVLYANINVDAPGVGSASFRLEVGGETSAGVTVTTLGGSETDTDKQMSLTWSATGNAIASINVQCTTTGTPTTAGWSWPKFDSDAYLANAPRSS